VPLGTFRTKPHEVVDLGVVRLPAPSTVEVRVLGIDDRPIRLTLLHVSTEHGEHVAHASVENGVRRLQLYPGSYRLKASALQGGMIVRSIEVQVPGGRRFQAGFVVGEADGQTVDVRVTR
jgi:hypothetical protein